MAATAEDIFEITMDLIDERLDSGLLNESDVVSYRVKTPGILTLLQAELLKQGDIYSSYEISNYPVTNLLGYSSNFDIRQFEGTELIFDGNSSARAYYFEVDNDATVYVEDFNGVWNTLATITATVTTSSFTAYSGLVTPTSGATKSRLRFTGSYYYRCINRALFSVPFAAVGDIPVYQPWVKKQMPTDFKSVSEIIEEVPDRQYNQASSYKWEGRRDMYMNYYFMGKVRIVYRPIPGVIAAISDTMQVDDVTARTIMPYGLASHLLLTENSDSANFFQQRYEELKKTASKLPPSATEMIGNMYGDFG